MFALNLRVSGRLFVGFAALCLVLVAAVGATIVAVRGVSDEVDRMAGLRASAAIASTELTAGLYATLAALRAYLLTGEAANKAERAAKWDELDRTVAAMDECPGRAAQPLAGRAFRAEQVAGA